MRIADVCIKDVQTIDPEASVTDAAAKMRDTHVGTLVVLDRARPGAHVVGILTDRDLVIKALATGCAPQATQVGNLMTRHVGVCRAQDDLFEAVAVMRKFGVRRLPVLDHRNNLVGIVSTDDVHGALGRVMDQLSQAVLREQLQEAERIR